VATNVVRVRNRIRELAGSDWVTFAMQATDELRRCIAFDGCCWHTVDPGTVLFTGSVNHEVGCSGSWLAEHEYVVQDVNKWSFLARSGRLAGATSLATHGDLSRSARHQSYEALGWGDDLRGSFVVDGAYWGAVGLLRKSGTPWYTEHDVRLLAALSAVMADGFRKALLVKLNAAADKADIGPGVVVFDANGQVESMSPAAKRWIAEMVELPTPSDPGDSKVVQSVAARARMAAKDLPARARVRTRSGSWLLLYGTPLSGGPDGRTAVIIQPATAAEVAPLVALAYGLSERERQVTQLCMQGLPTKEMARALGLSAYTVQDHLKSVFAKTGVGTRGELVGQIFLEHYVPRWEDGATPTGWLAKVGL
jgi:DNA-binding CsgD family transcriptional regulator